jgi:type III secretion protein W
MENSVDFVKNQIVILSLMRDEIREVSPTQVFRSLQHRDDLYFAIIETLEELEDELEDLEEKQLASEESEIV